MPRLTKWTEQGFIICTLLCLVVLSGCSNQFSEEVARKDFDKSGGTELILEVDMADATTLENSRLKEDVRQDFRERDRLRTEVIRVEDGDVLIRLRNAADMASALEGIKSIGSKIEDIPEFSGVALSIKPVDEKQFRVAYTPDYIAFTKTRLTEQSADVVRERNKNIERPRLLVSLLKGDQLQLLIPSSADNEYVTHLFQRQGNLSFHMVPEEFNNSVAADYGKNRRRVRPGTTYYPDTYSGGGLIVERRAKITGKCIKQASAGISPVGGYPIVNFSFDKNCTKLFGQLTQKNIGKRFAVVLDGEIITAPRINGAITGGAGFIEGNFSLESAKELARLLNSGPLPANLKIIKESTIKPKT